MPRRDSNKNEALKTSPKEKKIIECVECGAFFSQKHHLSRHLMIHTGERPFRCEKCGFAFTRKSSLTRHQLETCQKILKCVICGEEFRNKHVLQFHVEKCGHNDDSKLEQQINPAQELSHDQEVSSGDDGKAICSICGEKVHPRSIKRHILRAHKKKQAFKCDDCGNFFRRKDQLENHKLRCKKDSDEEVEEFEPEESFPEESVAEEPLEDLEANDEVECEYCEKTFDSMVNLRRHISKVHPNKKHYKCEKCGVAFKRFRELRHHENECAHVEEEEEEDEEKEESGEESDDESKESDVPSNFKPAHLKPFKCDDCGKRFRTKSNLSQHEMVHKDVYPFSCEKCGSRFKWQAGVSRHRKKQKEKCKLLQMSQKSNDEHEEPKVEVTIEEVSDDDFQDFEELNGKEESIDEYKEEIAPSNLKKRKRSTSKSKSKTYKCDECGQQFRSRNGWKDHQKLHSEVFEYSCEECGLQFKLRQTLNSHKRRCHPHENSEINIVEITIEEDSYEIEISTEEEKYFAESKGSSTTSKRREKKDSYKCDECGKEFKWHCELKNHRKIHGNVYSYRCEKCGSKFKQPQGLYGHRKNQKELCNFLTIDFTSIPKDDENEEIKLEEMTIEEVLEDKFNELELEESTVSNQSKEKVSGVKEDDSFKVPKSPKIPTLIIPKEDLKRPKKVSKQKTLMRKRKHLKIKARRIINRVMHYHVNEENEDGSVTPRWLPIFEVKDFNDVIEFEKFMDKVEKGSEDDRFVPQE